MKEDDDEKPQTSESLTVDTKDYLAWVIAMAETTMLPLILLVIVLFGVGLITSLLLLR